MNPLLLILVGLAAIFLGLIVGLRILAEAMIAAISGWKLPEPPASSEPTDNVVPIRKPEEPFQASQKETEQ